MIIFSLCLIFLVFASAFCSSSEVAFFSLPSSRVRAWKESKDPKEQKAAHLLLHSGKLLVLIFMMNTLVNVLIQNISSELFESCERAWWWKIGLPFFLIVFFGEFFPKYLGMLFSEPLAKQASSFFLILEKITFPIQKALTASSEILSRLFFSFLKQEPPLSDEELDEVLEELEKTGSLTKNESSLLSFCFDLEQKQARHLMVPRSEFHALDKDNLFLDSIIAFKKEYPAYQAILLIDKTLDHPFGALRSQDALLLKEDKDIENVLSSSQKQIFFVPETMQARKLLQEFQDQGKALACVVDEHNTISGFIEKNAFEKRLFEITSPLLPHQKSEIFPGTTSLETINTLFDSSISSEWNVVTLGGFLQEKLDEVPKAGTVYTHENILFRVIDADEKSIKQVFVQKIPTTGSVS